MVIFSYKQAFHCSSLTRIRTGGSAAYYVMVKNLPELIRVIFFANDKDLPFYLIGAGSNVLISDNDFKGCVIKLSGEFRNISFADKQVSCGAGFSLVKLGIELAKRGYNGYEYMAVIPGSVGGAVRINAGTTNEGEIKDHFVSALVLDSAAGTVRRYTKKDMHFSYRDSALANSSKIILQASLALPDTKDDPRAVLSNIRRLRHTRSRKQPKNPRTFGSVFKRPPAGKPAGWYLDKVGMRGLRIGNAMVPHEHANWIINIGNATSSEVKKLISIGRERVLNEFGILLEREVIYLPEDTARWD